MTGVNSAIDDSNSPTDPIKVTHVGTVVTPVRYPARMPLGKVTETGIIRFKHPDNYYFNFILKKTSEKRVTVICERHVKDETLKADSSIEADALEEDGGCFLRLYINFVDVNVKPKIAVLRCSDMSTSVEFLESSFLYESLHENNLYVLKCIVRRIETTVLSNKFARGQELLWKECMETACTSERQEKDIAYLLHRHKPVEFLTGRSTRHNTSYRVISRACHYSAELAQYFKSKENMEPVPSTFNVGLILGYLYKGREIPISGRECRRFYMYSLREGLTFVKELCTLFMTQNLNDELLVDVFEIADMTGDERLFDAAFLYRRENRLELPDLDKWKRLLRVKPTATCSIQRRIKLRSRGHLDYLGYPPRIEYETGED